MINSQKTYLNILFVICIFLLGFFVRFYQFSHIPGGLYPDETALGYNAYSILLTGKDEYGTHLPLYFRSFDDYKMPGYIYMDAVAIKLFGPTAFAVRFPSLFFGTLTLIALYFLIYILSGKKLLASIASLFLAFNPWHIFFSRTGYEVNVATAFLVFGTLFFVLGANKKNNIFLLFFSVCSFLVALYTYNVTRLISPLIFFSLIFFYRKNLIKESKKTLFAIIIVFILGFLPFLINQFTLQSQTGFSSQQDALITGKVAKAEILQTRSYFTSLPMIIQKTLFNYYVLLMWKFFQNLVTFFSNNFFFITGADHPHENIGGFGMFYYFDLPLMVYGAYVGIKKRLSYLYPFYWWFVCMLCVGGIIVGIPHDNAFGTRMFSVVIPLTVFAAVGMYDVIEKLLRIPNSVKKTVLFFAIAVILSYSYIFYLTSYFVRFPIESAKEWQSADNDLVTYISSIESNYDHIVFDDSTGFIYTSLLFYGKYPPTLHQKQAVYVLHGLVNAVVSDGKYEFRKVDFSRESQASKTLFITSTNNVPQNKKPLMVFYYPTRPVVLFYDRKIGQYPVTDIAYKVFSSK